MSPRPTLEPKQDRSVATRRALLDAAVDELLEVGYANLTASAVAHRAGVSRGAQQHHFAHKATLISEAIRHLEERQVATFREQLSVEPKGRARVPRTLDILFEEYSGRLFAAMLDIGLAAQTQPDLGELVTNAERSVSRVVQDLAAATFDRELVASTGFTQRWATAVSAIRGLALLQLLGHEPAAVRRQWVGMRRELVALLAGT